jgi:hypothetical protein
METRHNKFGNGLLDLFLEILRHLGGNLGVNYCCRDGQGGIQEVQTVFVSCLRDAWVGKFGRPQHVRKYYDSMSDKWLQSWEHRLPVGSIKCIGQFFERSPGKQWIVVKQLRLLQNGNDSDLES